MTKKKTVEEFTKQVFDLVGEEYIFLENYKGTDNKIKVRHNCIDCDNHEYYVKPDKFFNGRRCPVCSLKKKTTKMFIEEVYNLVGNEYVVLGEYVKNNIKVLMKHNSELCNNYEYVVCPTNFLMGNRCPICREINDSIRKTKTNEQFKKEIYEMVGDEYTFLEEYNGSSNKILVRHNFERCNNFEYEVSPSVFYQGCRCPACNESKGETKIRKFLNIANIKNKRQYKFNNCNYKNPLPFDFAVFNNNGTLECLIEYDGIWHYEVSKYSKNKDIMIMKYIETRIRDEIKNEYCKRNNIKLIRIPYWDFDNIEEILNNELKEVLINE